jgi:hypothetical protein
MTCMGKEIVHNYTITSRKVAAYNGCLNVENRTSFIS